MLSGETQCCAMVHIIFLVIFTVQIKTICTESAKHFFDKNELPCNISLYDDAVEWESWKNRGDPVIHIDLGKWADVMVIAPLDANTLAKISQV